MIAKKMHGTPRRIIVIWYIIEIFLVSEQRKMILKQEKIKKDNDSCSTYCFHNT